MTTNEHPQRGQSMVAFAFSFGTAMTFLHYAWNEIPPSGLRTISWVIVGLILAAACWFGWETIAEEPLAKA